MLKRNLIVIASFVALVGLIFLFGRHLETVKPTEKLAPTAPAVSQALPQETVVTLTDKGFAPSQITVTAGNAVRFVNQASAVKASVNSDDYPTNKKFPELNLGIFQKGSSLVHIFTQAGTYTYHNQFQPTQKGSVVVK